MRCASRWFQNPDPEQEEEEKRVGGLGVLGSAHNQPSRGKTAAQRTAHSSRSRRAAASRWWFALWERRLEALLDAADIVQGKGFAGGKEGCSWWEAAEQPIETNPKAGQRSSRKQSKPVRKDLWEEVKLWPGSTRTATGNRVTLWVSHRVRQRGKVK